MTKEEGWLNLCVIVKTCSDICFTIGQKNCQMFALKLHNFLHPHNRMRFYHAHSVVRMKKVVYKGGKTKCVKTVKPLFRLRYLYNFHLHT